MRTRTKLVSDMTSNSLGYFLLDDFDENNEGHPLHGITVNVEINSDAHHLLLSALRNFSATGVTKDNKGRLISKSWISDNDFKYWSHPRFRSALPRFLALTCRYKRRRKGFSMFVFFDAAKSEHIPIVFSEILRMREAYQYESAKNENSALDRMIETVDTMENQLII